MPQWEKVPATVYVRLADALRISRYVPTGTYCTMFRLEHFVNMFRLEHLAICSSRNATQERQRSVPAGTLRRLYVYSLLGASFPTKCSNWNIGSDVPADIALLFRLEHSSDLWVHKVANYVPTGTLDAFCTRFQLSHANSTLHSKRDSLYSSNQLWLLDNLWDASSLLPIRRAAWARLRLPSI
jgi:hypothetical protein